ncbi:MAG: CGNR zinc finger domain-containing protein [Anaerolineae bacterium]|nr:CGNR zinc finger domain-containing protein [Anaerolineae bacterium]
MPIFRWLGGWPCLDFVDSKNWDSDEPKYERFHRYTDLVWWNFQAHFLNEDEVEPLLAEAERQPDTAMALFERGMRLRTEIHRLFSRIATGETVSETALSTLNDFLLDKEMMSRIESTEQGFAWVWGGEAAALERVLWPIIRSAAELLVSDKLNRVGKCAGASCGWLFLDTSRNGRRRWCEMKHCGNRAKAKRHYRRAKTEESNSLD